MNISSEYIELFKFIPFQSTYQEIILFLSQSCQLKVKGCLFLLILGKKTRTRSITVSSQCGGSCSYALSEETNCTDYTDRNCDVGLWSSWFPSCVGRCPGK